MQFGTGSTATHTTPKLMETLVGKGLKQISAGVRHCAASNTVPPVRGTTHIRAPSEVPVQYTALKDVSTAAIYSRMLLLSHFSRAIMSSWKLFHLRANLSVSCSDYTMTMRKVTIFVRELTLSCIYIVC